MATATQKKKVHKVMHEHKEGTLKSGSGKKVSSRKQAVAIAMSESGQSKRRADDISTHAERPQAAGIVYAGDLGSSTCQTGGMA